MSKKRQSNIELLRIVSMMMVLIVHFDGAILGLPTDVTISNFTNLGTTFKLAIESFSIIGVNCFVLISGYFGIRFSARGAIKYTGWCMFYAVGTYAVMSIIKPEIFSWQQLGLSFLVYSHTDLWFVPAYFGLYILSPLLNKGIKAFNKSQFTWLIIGILWLNIYLGWLMNSNINPTGYNLMQMLMLYLIGRYIAKTEMPRHTKSSYAFVLWIMFVILIVASNLIMPTNKAFAYNSPFVMGASICFFLLFSTFSMGAKPFINWIASSAFAVYLLHKSPVVWIQIKSLVLGWSNKDSYFIFSLKCIAAILIIFWGSILIDKFRMIIEGKIMSTKKNNIVKNNTK